MDHLQHWVLPAGVNAPGNWLAVHERKLSCGTRRTTLVRTCRTTVVYDGTSPPLPWTFDNQLVALIVFSTSGLHPPCAPRRFDVGPGGSRVSVEAKDRAQTMEQCALSSTEELDWGMKSFGDESSGDMWRALAASSSRVRSSDPPTVLESPPVYGSGRMMRCRT